MLVIYSMKLLRNIMMIIFFSLLIMVVAVCAFYNYSISPVDKKNNDEIEVVIPNGVSTTEIGKILKEKDLIHSKNIFRVYCYIYKVNDLKAGTYKLKKSMKLESIVNVLKEGNTYNPDEIKITFNEGINMRKIASIIAKNTNNTEEDVLNLLKDNEYIDSLIKKYWFITDEIKNTNIYYSLEGYLNCDTYNFKNKDVSVKEIFEKLLDEKGKILEKYKKEIEGSNYSVHQLLTLASMVELEGLTDSDRAGIASVFYNRLNSKWSLGSDVTAYYANKIEMSTRDLTTAEYNLENPYNTRTQSMAGKLPVGPISNPSESSIKAVLFPQKTDYYFFVSDKNRKVYFSKTLAEQNETIKKLKQEGKWFEW